MATSKTSKQSLPIGCHVSIAGGVWNAPAQAAELGCETFQIFTRSPQGGPAPKLDDEAVGKFKTAMKDGGFTDFVIHCPYYINFGSGLPRTVGSSTAIVRGELERGSLLGGSYVMFHTGSGKDLGKEAAIAQAKAALEKVLDGYDGSCKLLIEIAAGAGEILGDTFGEVAALMEPLKKYPGFGGVCFDTQHAFASGYDLSSEAAATKTFDEFDETIGLEYLKVCHCNDSKVLLGARKDRHEHIGTGEIGENGFSAILKYFAKKKMVIPLILETEHSKVQEDIVLLKQLRDK